MIRTYFLTAFRSLSRHKGYTFLNIAGLTLGITCSLLLFLEIKHELSYDTFHAKRNQIYRLVLDELYEGNPFRSTSAHFPAANALRHNNPGINKLVPIYGENGGQVSVPQPGSDIKKHFQEEGPIAFTENAFFEIFSYETNLPAGKLGLNEPNNVVLTQTLANKYFPEGDAIGKLISVNNKGNLKVTAVIPDLPKNTDLPFILFISYPTFNTHFPNYEMDKWNTLVSNHNLYMELPANADTNRVQADINRILMKNLPEKKANAGMTFMLQPLSDFHYNPDFENYSERVISKTGINVMTIIGVFLLLTACINFINLATAQATRRAKEVGVRKVLGSSRRQLVLQFLGETFLITLAASLLSVILAELALPYLNKMLQLELRFSFLKDPHLLLFFVLQLVLVTLFAGLYPAFVLARFQPIAALKSKLAVQKVAGLSLRRALVLVQFTICQLLIICTLIVDGQMRFMTEKDLGFNKDAIIMVPLYKVDSQKLIAYRQEILQNPHIKNISFAMTAPSSGWTNTSNFSFNNSPNDQPYPANIKFTDEQYLTLFNIKLAAGENYPKAVSDSSMHFMINETMRRKLGLKTPEEAIGKTIAIGNWLKGRITGVVEDFHQNSLHAKIDPMILVNTRVINLMNMAVKIDPNQTKSVLQTLENTWQKTYPDNIFDYQFLDESIAEFYEGEQMRNTMFKVFSAISIFIGCLGLYGLVSFMVTQRTKEVGIRRVLGASTLNITLLFSREFLKLLLLAFVVAAPLAYNFMNDWLKDFEYRINIDPVPFVVAGIATLIIALLTMSVLTVRAARRNPVIALKTE